MDNLAKALAYEIQHDIAQRYFGFRTRIEGDIDQYRRELHSCSSSCPLKIEEDLQRLQFLFFKKDVFKDFLLLTQLPHSFTGEFSIAPPARHNNALWEELFINQKGQGLTRRGRHKNLVYRIYKSLASRIAEYKKVYLTLREEHQDICEEITAFSRNNDLASILSFLRELQSTDSLRSQLFQSTSGPNSNLDKELQIQLPPPVTTSLQPLEELPELGQIKRQLQIIINKAYSHSNPPDLPSLPF